VLVERRIDVDVPAGIQDGQRIRISGAGHAGSSGARGNAYVVVRVRPDSRFLRDGDDLHTVVRLTMTEAALGTTARVPTLEGDLDFDVEAGTQPGVVRVLRGKGMPALHGHRRGDLYVRLDVAVPTRLSDEQRALLERFESRTGADAYVDDGEDDGFFARLKSALR
jgi:molecular chaperone DnaJ